MKLDVQQIADEAVRAAWERHREALTDIVNKLADESAVIVNGVRHVNAARLLAVLTATKETT